MRHESSFCSGLACKTRGAVWLEIRGSTFFRCLLVCFSSLRDFDQADSSGISLVNDGWFSRFFVLEHEEVVVYVVQREDGFLDGDGVLEVETVDLHDIGSVRVDEIRLGVRKVDRDVVVFLRVVFEFHGLEGVHQILSHAVAGVVSFVATTSVFLKLGRQSLGSGIDRRVHVRAFFLAVDGQTLEGGCAIHSVSILDLRVFADGEMDLAFSHESSAAELVQ
mmetsp:Transcript_14240/g.29740  ORF Transcript_14240/g.29740 Transcript_14240/m.29740 type:complete len:221 (-) Transcript_14240:280-942(-)